MFPGCTHKLVVVVFPGCTHKLVVVVFPRCTHKLVVVVLLDKLLPSGGGVGRVVLLVDFGTLFSSSPPPPPPPFTHPQFAESLNRIWCYYDAFLSQTLMITVEPIKKLSKTFAKLKVCLFVVGLVHWNDV